VEEILGALLDISRLDTGVMRPEITTFPLDEMLRQLEVEFAPLAREKGLQLIFVATSLSVRSDRRLLRRMLQNLISNAIKYTLHGRVLIGCRRRKRRLRIEICDTGLGVPNAKRRAIFKEFHRLDQGAKVARGLGLGLSIVERIGKVLDHKVDLDSTPGRGSRFWVEAPIATATPASKLKPMSRRADGGQLRDMVLLCIDNEPEILRGMQTLLGGWGCTVLTAADLKGATALLKQQSLLPHGLLVDYHLDDGNGMEAIMQLRWRLGADLPAILVTADRSPHVRDEARARNVQVLHKPLKPAALRALIAQWRVHQVAAE
jgi:CheY-like chemotaxis protein